MLTTLLTILPLDLAATLSPGILALSVVLLGERNKAIERSIALFFGNILTGIIIAFAGFYLGEVKILSGQTTFSMTVDLLLGVFFVFFGFKVYFSKDKKIKLSNKKSGPHFFKWLIIGFIISITNFDAVLLSFAAAREVSLSNLVLFNKLILIITNIFFFVLPVSFPLCLYLIFPKIAKRFLDKLDKYLVKYGRYIITFLFIVFGVILILRAIKNF